MAMMRRDKKQPSQPVILRLVPPLFFFSMAGDDDPDEAADRIDSCSFLTADDMLNTIELSLTMVRVEKVGVIAVWW